MAAKSRAKQTLNFAMSLPKTIDLKKSKVKVEIDHPSRTEFIDILVNPASDADKKAIFNRWREDKGSLQKWYHTQDMGYVRAQVVHYGKRKEPALFISAIQPAVFWEMPSKFRKRYDDWYKKLYEELEKIAKKRGIKRVLISTPRAVRTTTAEQQLEKAKFPYHMLEQLYYSFPEKQGFKKKRVLVQGKSNYIEFRGQKAVSRKLWYKNLRRH